MGLVRSSPTSSHPSEVRSFNSFVNLPLVASFPSMMPYSCMTILRSPTVINPHTETPYRLNEKGDVDATLCRGFKLPVHLQPKDILEALSHHDLKDTIRKLLASGQMPLEGGERTLQAWVWSFLLEKTFFAKLRNGDPRFYPDWKIFIEVYDGEGHFPDVSFRKSAEDQSFLFAIEIKHYPSSDALFDVTRGTGKSKLDAMIKDVHSLNSRDCQGALFVTVPNQRVFTGAMDRLTEESKDGTHIIAIESR